MKFVTVMDMWLLIMNGILLIAILYYGKKLMNLVSNSFTDADMKKATELENQRVVSIINRELNIFKSAQSMGDHSFDGIIEEINVILGMIKK